jgi:hypothetical protein
MVKVFKILGVPKRDSVPYLDDQQFEYLQIPHFEPQTPLFDKIFAQCSSDGIITSLL